MGDPRLYEVLAGGATDAPPKLLKAIGDYADGTGAAAGGITLGSRQTATAFANIGVAELVIMNAAATAAERAGFRSYVAQRYGF